MGHGGLSVLCANLLNIEYIDVAELTVSTIELISEVDGLNISIYIYSYLVEFNKNHIGWSQIVACCQMLSTILSLNAFLLENGLE